MMRKRRRLSLLALAVAAIAIAGTTAAFAGDNDAGFKTSQPAMLTCPSCGQDVVPILTVGDRIGDYRFEAIPDGISIQARGNGRADLFVNHETSTVAFNYVAAGPTAANSQNDFLNSQVSLVGLNQHSKGVLFGRYPIDSNENFQRFCSNYLATKAEGFDRDLFFTNEEGQDWVFRSGTAWQQPIAAGTAGAEQLGVVVATDPKNGKHKVVYGMGRHNHENNVAIPGFDDLVVLSGDDTFFTTPVTTTAIPQSLTYDTRAWSQLYNYIAPNTNAIWADTGDLWAFVSSNTAYKDYYDFTPGDTAEISGEFIKVPKMIATGKKADGTELRSTDFPGMLPPPQGSGIPDGPQWVLDQWGNAANNEYGKNVFRFVRIEDIAYDKRPSKSNIVYLADSGRAQTGPGNVAGKSTNGRIWKLQFSDETHAKLSILIDGDTAATASSASSVDEATGSIHQPDNVETTVNSLMVQEDPSTANTFPAGSTDGRATNARLWRYSFATATKSVAATVDQSAASSAANLNPSKPGNIGSWESSGVVDASSLWGPGWFLLDVQAHTLWIETAPGPDVVAPAGPDWTFKREGGQLLAIRIPGA
jgi:hypothetical protein